MQCVAGEHLTTWYESETVQFLDNFTVYVTLMDWDMGANFFFVTLQFNPPEGKQKSLFLAPKDKTIK